MANKDTKSDPKASEAETKAWGKAAEKDPTEGLLPGSQPDKPLNVAVVPAQPAPAKPPEQSEEPKPEAPEMPEESGNLAGYPARPEVAQKIVEGRGKKLRQLEAGRSSTENMTGFSLRDEELDQDPTSLVNELFSALYAAKWHRTHPRLMARVERWLANQTYSTSSASSKSSSTTSKSDPAAYDETKVGEDKRKASSPA